MWLKERSKIQTLYKQRKKSNKQQKTVESFSIFSTGVCDIEWERGGGGGVGAYPQDAFYFGSGLVILSLMQTKAEERVLSKNYLRDKHLTQ